MGRAILVLTAALALSACESDNNTQGSAPASGTSLTLEFTNLTELLNGFHFEGWAIVGGQPISTGKFNINTQGEITDLTGQVIAGGTFIVGQDISHASAIVVSVEPTGDADSIPADTKILAGDLSNGSSTLTVGHSVALGNDFVGSTGNVILATPTDADTTNELSGIWFLELPPPPTAGLSLPGLPPGWKYEGWGVPAAGPLTTGTFLTIGGADEMAPFSGPLAGPAFPGEDFLENPPAGHSFPMDLSGSVVVVSVEPFPDDDPAPFQLKPLLGTVPLGVSSGVVYPLANQAAGTFPTGSAIVL